MGRPSSFQDLTLSTADSAAKASGRFLLVEVTARWSRRCAEMDRTAWVDPELVLWISEKAVAVQIEVDSAAAGPFKVNGLPTVIVQRNGNEIDRIMGTRAPDALLAWLKGIEVGRTELDRLRAAPRTDLVTRLSLAESLVQRGLDDEATEELAWLWEHSLEVDASWIGVRNTFLVVVLFPLIQRSQKARERFRTFLAAAQAQRYEARAARDVATLSKLLAGKSRGGQRGR